MTFLYIFYTLYILRNYPVQNDAGMFYSKES